MKTLKKLLILGTFFVAECSGNKHYTPEKAEVYTFEYEGKPSAIIEENNSSYYIELNGEGRLVGEITSDDGKLIKVYGVHEFFHEVYGKNYSVENKVKTESLPKIIRDYEKNKILLEEN